MREITREMIKEYRLMKLGYDFMGYEIKNKQDLSFHHLIVLRRNCKDLGLGEGYLKWNGSILNQNTSHDYLHLIEAKDLDMFMAITSEMIDQNIKGCLDIESLRRIRDILECFGRGDSSDIGTSCRLLIRDGYVGRRKF